MGRSSTAQRVIAALTAALVLGGCASIHPANPAAPGVDLDAINANLAGRVALVKLKDGTEFLARDVRLSESLVTLRRQRFADADLDWSVSEAEGLPAHEVLSVQVSRKVVGALQGGLIGLGVGAAAGAASGALLPGPDDDLSTFIGAAIVGALGGCLGFLVGSSVGSPEVYDLSTSPAGGERRPGE